MINPIANKHIILCVTGSIACYKAADLASKLTQAGAQVDVLLTESALQFVTPLTFQSVTGRRAFTDADLWGHEAHVLHVGLGHNTDMIVIAPATANTMAKLANGLADNLVTVTALAAHCPLLIAPAMDGGMFSHAATQANLETLRTRGAVIVGPASGHLASGLVGVGRMVEAVDILGQIRQTFSRQGPLKGRKFVVTAGGTQEPVDPVRVIANRSSGKQGFHLAQAALDLGADVTLVTGITNLPTPDGAHRINVTTAEEMRLSVLQEMNGTDVLLMAAAVADFRPLAPALQKIKKEGGLPEIQLEHTPDILKAVAENKSMCGFPGVTVGFAAESQNLLENAAAKMRSKKLDLIVANDITARDAGFAVDTNRVTLIAADGSSQELPLMSKADVAQAVLERVIVLLKDDPLPVVHITNRQEWEIAQLAGDYQAPSFADEGFIHFSCPGQVLKSANAHFAGQKDLLLLWVAPQMLTTDLRWERSGDELFPHLYGPLNLDAVTAVTPFSPDSDGVFRNLPKP